MKRLLVGAALVGLCGCGDGGAAERQIAEHRRERAELDATVAANKRAEAERWEQIRRETREIEAMERQAREIRAEADRVRAQTEAVRRGR